MLRLFRGFFKLARAIFRLSRIGKIRIGGELLYVPIRRKLYRFFWKFSAPSLDKPLDIGGHKICGIGPNRGGQNGMGLLMDTYEEDSTRLFNELVQENMNVIDIGAHIGYYTLHAARKVGNSGRVYAFEPENENYKWLLRNIEINNYSNVTASEKAVTDSSGSVKLWLAKGTGSHSLHPNFGEIREETSKESDSVQKNEIVKSTSLDDFLELQGWPIISVIKIDVEGAEPQVFSGMKKLLERQKELKIIFEFNRFNFQNSDISASDFLKSLQEKGFKLFSIGKLKANLMSDKDIFFLSEKSSTNTNLLAVKGNYEN